MRQYEITSDFEIVSMDDQVKFGAVLYRLTFGEATERDLLSDYQVLVIGVGVEPYRRYAEEGRLVTRDGEEIVDARFLAAQIGIAKAIRVDRQNKRRFPHHRYDEF
jgi:predicted helicase